MPNLLKIFSASSEELQKVLELVDQSCLIAITDIQGNITFANENFCNVSQYSQEELLGQNFRIFKSGHQTEYFYEDLWKTITEGKTWRGENQNRAKDGSLFWVKNVISPTFHKSDDQKPLFFISIQNDITEQKRLDLIASKLSLELKEARLAIEEQNQLISTIGHDLKSPLMVARIYAQKMEKKFVVAEKIQMLSGKITKNIDRVDKMISKIIDSSTAKDKNHHCIIECTKFDINQLAMETLESLSIVYGERFVFVPKGEITGFWCDSSIKRIIENLATNAIKYGDKNHKITINIFEANNKVKLSVHNVGNPIAAVNLKTIFDYLERTHQSILGDQPGWGVGLHVVKTMAELHGGSVHVSSDSLNGTNFTVTLPKDATLYLSEETLNSSNFLMTSECNNFLRLFRHMPEMLVILSGPNHVFEFVSDSYVRIIGTDYTGKSLREFADDKKIYLKILDEVFKTGIPFRVKRAPISIKGEIRYFNHTWVPRKNKEGAVIGILSLSSEV